MSLVVVIICESFMVTLNNAHYIGLSG